MMELHGEVFQNAHVQDLPHSPLHSDKHFVGQPTHFARAPQAILLLPPPSLPPLPQLRYTKPYLSLTLNY